MNNRKLTITAVTLIALIGIIGFVNIRSIQSNTNTDYTGTTLESGEPEVHLRNPMNLYIMGDDTFTKILEKHLIHALEESYIDVTIIEELEPKYDDQTLIVKVTDKNIQYNPVLPSAEVQTDFYYFSNGDTSYLDPLINNLVVEMHDGPVLVQEGEIQLRDTSRGFASYKGYLDHLASKTVESIMAHLPGQ